MSFTKEVFGTSGSLSTLIEFHENPPSIVTCISPSSVPAYKIFSSIGDSLNDVIVL